MRGWAGVALVALVSSSSTFIQVATSPKASSLDDVLRAAGAYLTTYAPNISGVVAEEDYEQQVSAPVGQFRHLRSDVIVLADSSLGWATFRDVFEVDGQSVRDRADRIAALLAKPNPIAWQDPVLMANASTRFNQNLRGVSVNRSHTVPIAALLFFGSVSQRQSTFKITGEEMFRGHRVTLVHFDERGRPG